MKPQPWQVRFASRRVEREFRRLPQDVTRRVWAAIAALAYDRHPPGSVPVQGHPGDFRIRVGDYRFIYHEDEENEIVYIDRIGSKDEHFYRYR